MSPLTEMKKTTVIVSRRMIQGSICLFFFNVKSEMPIRHPIKLPSRQAQARKRIL